MMAPAVDYPSWLSALDEDDFDEVVAAAEAVVLIQEALASDNLSLLNELFRDLGDGPIEQWVHYPADDSIDAGTGAMFYYHAHDPDDWSRDEHGHFHLFVRPSATVEAEFNHFLAISMTPHGTPCGLFTTNRWVTDETLLPAPALLERVETRFEINRARPSWLVAQWLTAVVALVRPHLAELLRLRDRALNWGDGQGLPDERLTEDRSVHVLSEMPFDLLAVLTDVRAQAAIRYGSEA